MRHALIQLPPLEANTWARRLLLEVTPTDGETSRVRGFIKPTAQTLEVECEKGWRVRVGIWNIGPDGETSPGRAIEFIA